MSDAAAFIATLDLEDGRPLELAPFQRAALDAMLSDRWPFRAELAARRYGRLERHADFLAIALLAGGHTVVTAGDTASAGQLLDRVAARVKAHAADLDVELPAAAAELVRITPASTALGGSSRAPQ